MSESYFQRPYSDFEPLVRDIRAGVSDAEYLGRGAESTVWRVSLEGLNYAVKRINPYSPRGRKRDLSIATETSIESSRRGLGIAGLEQFCAASVEDGVIVCNFVDGTNMSAISDDEITSITPGHLNDLRKTVFLASEAGIEIDGWNNTGSNAFFSPDTGFTLIDYGTREGISYENNLTYTLRSLGRAGGADTPRALSRNHHLGYNTRIIN